MAFFTIPLELFKNHKQNEIPMNENLFQIDLSSHSLKKSKK